MKMTRTGSHPGAIVMPDITQYSGVAHQTGAGHMPGPPQVGLNGQNQFMGPCGSTVWPSGLPADTGHMWAPQPAGTGGMITGDEYGRSAVLTAYKNSAAGEPARFMFDITAQHRGFFEFSLCPCTNPADDGTCTKNSAGKYGTTPEKGHSQGTYRSMRALSRCFAKWRLPGQEFTVGKNLGAARPTGYMLHPYVPVSDQATPAVWGEAGAPGDKFAVYWTDHGGGTHTGTCSGVANEVGILPHNRCRAPFTGGTVIPINPAPGMLRQTEWIFGTKGRAKPLTCTDDHPVMRPWDDWSVTSYAPYDQANSKTDNTKTEHDYFAAIRCMKDDGTEEPSPSKYVNPQYGADGDHGGAHTFVVEVKLPAEVYSDNAIIQWHYQDGNSDSSSHYPEFFSNCADVSLLSGTDWGNKQVGGANLDMGNWGGAKGSSPSKLDQYKALTEIAQDGTGDVASMGYVVTDMDGLAALNDGNTLLAEIKPPSRVPGPATPPPTPLNCNALSADGNCILKLRTGCKATHGSVDGCFAFSRATSLRAPEADPMCNAMQGTNEPGHSTSCSPAGSSSAYVCQRLRIKPDCTPCIALTSATDLTQYDGTGACPGCNLAQCRTIERPKLHSCTTACPASKCGPTSGVSDGVGHGPCNDGRSGNELLPECRAESGNWCTTGVGVGAPTAGNNYQCCAEPPLHWVVPKNLLACGGVDKVCPPGSVPPAGFIGCPGTSCQTCPAGKYGV